MRHGRVLVLDARVVSPLNRSSPRHRQPLRKWLEAIASAEGDTFDEVVFVGCRFHRDDQALLEAIVPRAPAVGFVGGLPRRLEAFEQVDKLTLGCRAPEGLVPAAAFHALRASGVDPVSFSVELGRAQIAPEKTVEAMFAWLLRGPSRLRRLSLAGCFSTGILRLAEAGLELERVHWEGRLTAQQLEFVVKEELPFALSISATPGSDRGLAGHVPDGVAFTEGGPPVCPWG